MADYPKTNVDTNEEESVFDLKKLWALFYLNWYWVVLSVIVCLVGSFLYIRFQAPVYRASMKLLVKDAEKNRYGGGSMGMALDELGMMSNSNGFDNELEILCSTSLSTKVVKNLKLYTTYFLEGTIKNAELYKTSPVLLDLEGAGLDALPHALRFVVTKTSKGVHLDGYFDKEDPKQLTFAYDAKQLPDTVATPFGKLSITANASQNEAVGEIAELMQEGKKLFVTIVPPQLMGRYYAAQMGAAPTSKMTTVASVAMSDTKPQRALDYLHGLVVCYNEDANEDKNEVARKTEEFLSERLEGIKRELDATEGTIESYKIDNELINLANDATTALQASEKYKQELAQMQTQCSLLKTLVDYMADPANYLQVIPANLGLDASPMVAPLVKTMTDYNEMVLTRNRYLRASGEDNPVVVQLTSEIEVMWPTIRSNMNNIYENMEMQKDALEKEYLASQSRIHRTPTQERMLTGIARQQTLQSEVYLTLLQKREENIIQLYSTAAKGRIIDAPIVLGKVSPRGSIIMLFALVLGIAFPIGLFLLIDLL